MASEQIPESKPASGARVAETASFCARKAIETGGVFDPAALRSAATAIALVRRVFDSIAEPAEAGRPRGGGPLSPQRMALWAVEAAGTLVALRRGPQGPAAGLAPQAQVTREVLEEALRVLEEREAEVREEVEAVVLEAAGKALRVAWKLAGRSAVS